MAYRITRHDRSLQKALRRIAREQIDAALSELAAPGADPTEAVHQIRKHFKKLRGLLRLVRPGFDGYAAENAAIRDLAAGLSGLRDVGALVETHDKLMVGAPDAGRFDPIRAHFVAQAPSGTPPLPEGLRDELLAMRDRVAHWHLKGKDKATLHAGLSLTYARAAAGYRAARESPSAENIHEWRKRVKYNWYHTRLLRDINRKRMQPHREAAKKLAGLLGDHHDLSVYLATLDRLAQDPPPGLATGQISELTARARTRQTDLADRACTLGEEMLYKTPGKLPKLWARWWADWRAD